MVAAIVVVPASPAAALPSDFSAYQIHNHNSHLCLGAKEDPPVVGTTQIVQKSCDKTDRLQGWYNHIAGTPGIDVPILQRSPVGIMWLTSGTWCIGGDTSSPGHPVKIVGTYQGYSNCLSFWLWGNAASGVMLSDTVSGYCLAVAGGSKVSGAGLIFWPCKFPLGSGPEQVFDYPQPIPDFHGGMKIKPDFGNDCTLGFNVYDQANNPYFLTAGHCVNPGQDWRVDDDTALNIMKVPIGQTVTSANDAAGDWALVQYENAGYTAYGVVSFTPPTDWIDITGSRDPNPPDPNAQEPVYFWGATSDHAQSGHIRNPYSSFHSISNVIETDICTKLGDSGGPLVGYDTNRLLNQALGTLIGGDGDTVTAPNCHSYFMPISTIRNQILAQTNRSVHVY